MEPSSTLPAGMRLYQRRRSGPPLAAPVSAPRVSRRQTQKAMAAPSALPNAQTPKRSRTTDKDQEFMKGYCLSSRQLPSFFEKTAPFDYVVAVNNVRMRWPECSDLSGWDAPKSILQHVVLPDMNFAHLAGNCTFTRTPKVDPTSRALAASGALVGNAQGFCMCG